VLSASASLAREIRSGTALAVLSKPVGRAQFLLAKFAGLIVALSVLTYVNLVAALLASRMAFDAYGSTDLFALGLFVLSLVAAYVLGGFSNFFLRRPFVSDAVFSLLVMVTVAFVVINFFDQHGAPREFATGVDWRLIPAAVLMMQVTIDTHPNWFDTAASRADLRLVFLCLILGMTSWTGLCRLLRGETLKLRELEYIQAAQSFGVSSLRILSRHIMPNVMHIILIALVMDFSGLVLAEAVLSYVGVGVDPSMISFGTMINGARLEMAREPMVWWALAAAFSFMLVLVLAANLFADAVRDAFDPRMNRT